MILATVGRRRLVVRPVLRVVEVKGNNLLVVLLPPRNQYAGSVAKTGQIIRPGNFVSFAGYVKKPKEDTKAHPDGICDASGKALETLASPVKFSVRYRHSASISRLSLFL